MDVNEAIRTKRAVRKYDDKPLPDEAVKAILNAGRRAQSAKNMQRWNFIAIQEKEILLSLAQLGHYTKHIAGAALSIAILTPPQEERFSILFDAGQAAAYMQLAALGHGIGSCLATIYEPEKARQLLEFPQEWHIHIAISFGFPAKDELAGRAPKKTGRRTFDEVVHWEKW